MDGQTTKNTISPSWYEHVFEKEYLLLLKQHPNKFFHVPLGSSAVVDGSTDAPSELRTQVPVMFQQHDEEFCLVNSVASALQYCNYKDEASQIAASASKLSVLPGNFAITELMKLMAKVVSINGKPTIYNQRRNKKPPKIMTMMELLVPSPYVTLVQPMCGDGGADHAVCVVDDLIFDTRFKFALHLKEKTFHWICGSHGMKRLGPIYRFNQNANGPCQKKPRPVKRHW